MTTQILDKVTAGGNVDQDDLRLLETLAAMAAPEPEPEDKVAHKGDETVPAIVRTATKSAGYIYLRRNTDGKLVLINKNQLPQRLRQKLPDGSPGWLSPSTPWTGRTRIPDRLCPLNINHPDRARMDALNLGVCTKRGKLMGDAALRRHLMKKHKDDWEAIQRDEERRRQDRRDEHETKMSEALTTALSGGNSSVAARVSDPVTLECAVCHETFEGAKRLSIQAKLRWHMKKAHPAGVGAGV